MYPLSPHIGRSSGFSISLNGAQSKPVDDPSRRYMSQTEGRFYHTAYFPFQSGGFNDGGGFVR